MRILTTFAHRSLVPVKNSTRQTPRDGGFCSILVLDSYLCLLGVARRWRNRLCMLGMHKNKRSISHTLRIEPDYSYRCKKASAPMKFVSHTRLPSVFKIGHSAGTANRSIGLVFDFGEACHVHAGVVNGAVGDRRGRSYKSEKK